jgi:hypothetical protein
MLATAWKHFLCPWKAFNKSSSRCQDMQTYHRSTLTSPRPSLVLSVPAVMNVSRHANAEIPAPRAIIGSHQNKIHHENPGSNKNEREEPTISHLHPGGFCPLVPASDCTISTRRHQPFAVRTRFQTCDSLMCLGYCMHKREVCGIEIAE